MISNPIIKTTNNDSEQSKSKRRDCPKCNFETHENLSNCPKCNVLLWDEAKHKSMGQLKIILGRILTILMTVVFVGVSALLLYTDSQPKSDFALTNKRPSKILLFLTVGVFCGGLIAFSEIMVSVGRKAQETGRSNRKKMRTAIWIILAALTFLEIVMILYS